MKKVLLSLGAAVLLAGAAQAQVSYGLRAGVNLGKVSGIPSELSEYQTNNTSFHVTGYADLPVAPNFSVQPGVSLQGKGQRYSASGSLGNGTASRNVMSIEIPVNAVYYIPTGYTGSVFLGAGPYLGFNVSGRDRADGDFVNALNFESERDLSFSGDNRDLNLIDAGVNFMAGYKFNGGLLLNAGYGLGLTNLNPNSNGNSMSNRVWSFGAGFQF